MGICCEGLDHINGSMPRPEDPEFVPDPEFVDYYVRMILDAISHYGQYLKDPDFAKEQVPMIESCRELWLSGKFSMADVISMSEQWLDILRRQRDNYASNIGNRIRFAKDRGLYPEDHPMQPDTGTGSDGEKRESRWSRIWKAITGIE